MIRRSLTILMLAATGAAAQSPDAARQALQQRLAAIRQSIAQNQAQLRHYSWTESTEIRIKGQVKELVQNECKYGPGGQLVKTPIGSGPAGSKINEDLTAYMDRVGSLVSRYVPPNPESMLEAFQAGRANLDRASGVLAFNDYAKPGDRMTLVFDPATKKIRSYEVATYLDEPKDVVNLNAQFSTLPDGTNYLEEYVLDATAKQIRIKTINFDHTK